MINNTHQPLYPDVMSFDEVPVDDKQRKRTDIFCCVCSSIFALTLFIVACATFNNWNLVKMTYFADGVGNTCALQTPDYPIVYFTSFTDPAKRLCVSECPTGSQSTLKCYPTNLLACGKNTNPKYQVQIYPSEVVANRIGLICMPKDAEQYKIITQFSDLQNKYHFLTVYDSIWTSLWISIVFGIVLILLMQFIPRKLVHWIFFLGAMAFVAVGIVIFIVPTGFVLWKIIIGIVLLFMGLLAILSIAISKNRQEIFICSRLFEIAAHIVKEKPLVLGYVFLWWVFQVGLIALTSFEMLSAWSIGPLNFSPEYPFWEVGAFISNFLSVLIFIQFIWGLSFLKEAFNFCVSGFATLWYCHSKTNPAKVSYYTPFSRLIKYHWGSVVGGSLLLWLFYFVDLFIDFFETSSVSRAGIDKTHQPSSAFTRQTVNRRGCSSLFDLVRSEAFGYINLIPIPYCNASRYCEMLDQQSHFYDRSQTTNRLYRLCAHMVIMTIATSIAFAANKHTDHPPTILGLFFVSIVSLFCVTYFVALHGDLAQGIYISTIFNGNGGLWTDPSWTPEQRAIAANNNIFRPPNSVRDLYLDDIAGLYDNTTFWDYLVGHVKNDHRYHAS